MTEQDGEVAQDAHGIPTYVYVDHVCAQHQCLNQLRHECSLTQLNVVNGLCSKCLRISSPLWLVRFCACASTTWPHIRSAYLVLSARTKALWPLPARGTEVLFFLIFFLCYNLYFPMGGVNGLWARLYLQVYPQVCWWPQLGRSRVRSKVRGQWPRQCKHPPPPPPPD